MISYITVLNCIPAEVSEALVRWERSGWESIL